MPLLFWAGGTYARRPDDFPQEQSSAAWLEEFLLPLELKAPVFEWHASLEDLAKTWRSTKWHGKAPHPYAIKEAFPYAIASMRKYWDDYKEFFDAKDVPRESPWSNFQRKDGNDDSAARPADNFGAVVLNGLLADRE